MAVSIGRLDTIYHFYPRNHTQTSPHTRNSIVTPSFRLITTKTAPFLACNDDLLRPLHPQSHPTPPLPHEVAPTPSPADVIPPFEPSSRRPLFEASPQKAKHPVIESTPHTRTQGHSPHQGTQTSHLKTRIVTHIIARAVTNYPGLSSLVSTNLPQPHQSCFPLSVTRLTSA